MQKLLKTSLALLLVTGAGAHAENGVERGGYPSWNIETATCNFGVVQGQLGGKEPIVQFYNVIISRSNFAQAVSPWHFDQVSAVDLQTNKQTPLKDVTAKFLRANDPQIMSSRTTKQQEQSAGFAQPMPDWLSSLENPVYEIDTYQAGSVAVIELETKTGNFGYDIDGQPVRKVVEHALCHHNLRNLRYASTVEHVDDLQNRLGEAISLSGGTDLFTLSGMYMLAIDHMEAALADAAAGKADANLIKGTKERSARLRNNLDKALVELPKLREYSRDPQVTATENWFIELDKFEQLVKATSEKLDTLLPRILAL